MSSSPSLFRSLLHGALGFALVSVAAFSIWAFLPGLFRGFGGELGLYAAIAAVFLGLSGLILGPLAGGMGRFYSAFLPAFLVYSVIWTLAWFLLKGRLGEWVGAALGCAAFSYLALARLKAPSGWLTATLELFLLHTAGYFVGSWVMYSFWLNPARASDFASLDRPLLLTVAKLSWGACYGLGFGAGIGWVFHRARVGA